MAETSRTAYLFAACSLAALAGSANARSISKHLVEPQMQMMSVGPQFMADFALDGPAVGGPRAPASAAVPARTGSTIAVVDGDILVIDADSGKLVRSDREGRPRAKLAIGPDAALLVVDHDRRRAYVTDRRRDRVVVVDLAGDGLRRIDAFTTPTEPYGLALSPDGRTLLVTAVADERLVALDTGSGLQRWSLDLGPEPRGVTISPDGRQALVTFLTTGVVGRVDLRPTGDDAAIEYLSLDPAAPSAATDVFGRAPMPGAVRDPDQGHSFVRNAFVAGWVGNGVAVVPHQLSTPHLADEGMAEVPTGGYGGGSGFTPPVSHRLAFLSLPEAGAQGSVSMAMATVNVHQPRAMAYDGVNDTMYLAGYGSDEVVAIAGISQASVHFAWRLATGEGCGPTGLAVDPDDGSVVAFCSLSRRAIRVAQPAEGAVGPQPPVAGPELAQSRLSVAARRGREVFRRGNSPMISTGGAMACSSCHAEARSDGLSWFLQGKRLQTPFLAGRLQGAHPFKWDGKDPTLEASLTNTVQRLGGGGLTKAEVRDLSAFLETVRPPRTPAAEDPAAVARGKALFESSETACSECHNGPLLADGKRHEMAEDLDRVDTPSLIGLASSAPYYHDGSAPTLTALLRGKGNVHGMGRTSRLSDAQVGDLVAYLRSI